MKPVSKFSIIITVIAVVIIGWIVFTHHDTQTPLNTTSDPTMPDVQATWPTVEIERKTINDSNQYYSIEAMYPVTKDTALNDKFKAFVEDLIAQFKTDTSWVMDPTIGSASEGELLLDITYREERNAVADNYIFSITTYTGGAHGLQVTRTFSFDQYGAPIALTDLFSNADAGLKSVAMFVEGEIIKKKIADTEWIKDGTAPREENYRNFVVGETGVTFIFDPYQAGPYSAGIQNILVPLSVFKSNANTTLFR